MPLQNRVSPRSEIVAVSARGGFMGNRGRLHRPDKTLVKTTWGWKFWIICSLEWKGIRRELMQPRSYTELFFLDEAVALAAGHRPCALCRRSAFKEYQAACSTGGGLMRAPEMDAVLHEERVRGHWGGEYPVSLVEELPDGVFVERLGVEGSWLVWEGQFWKFGFEGYEEGGLVGSERVRVLTPELSVRALREGYRVAVHPSTEG